MAVVVVSGVIVVAVDPVVSGAIVVVLPATVALVVVSSFPPQPTATSTIPIRKRTAIAHTALFAIVLLTSPPLSRTVCSYTIMFH
jgi:hypothetical protein